MQMTKKARKEFFKKLEGPEGCNFRKVKGEISWKCGGGRSKVLSIAILNKMGICAADQQTFLQECDDSGGHCDCEIIFNVEK